MKINPISSYTKYSAPAVGAARERKSETVRPGGKSDAVTFSAGWQKQKEIGQISNSVLRSLNEPEDPARLEELRQAVASNTYFVSSDDLAAAIMGRAALA